MTCVYSNVWISGSTFDRQILNDIFLGKVIGVYDSLIRIYIPDRPELDSSLFIPKDEIQKFENKWYYYRMEENEWKQ